MTSKECAMISLEIEVWAMSARDFRTLNNRPSKSATFKGGCYHRNQAAPTRTEDNNLIRAVLKQLGLNARVDSSTIRQMSSLYVRSCKLVRRIFDESALCSPFSALTERNHSS